MRSSALLVAGMVAVVVLAGCSDDTLPSTANAEQSSGTETLPAGQESGTPEEVDGEPAPAAPAPTVLAQAPGSPLLVGGAELAAPAEWQISGVSSDDTSEVVGATSADGQFISLRSVRTDAAVDEQIAAALEADAEQTVEAPEVAVEGETLRGVETALTASGGQAIRLQYFVRRGDSLITIDIVTTAEQQQALLEHLRSGLTWR